MYVVTPTNGSIETVIKAKSPEEFSGLLEITGNVYVKSTNGILKVEGDKLIPSNLPWPDNLVVEFGASSPVSHNTLLSVLGGRLFVASTDGIKEVNVQDKDFLLHNIPIAATYWTDELVAIGTLRGGGNIY